MNVVNPDESGQVMKNVVNVGHPHLLEAGLSETTGQRNSHPPCRAEERGGAQVFGAKCKVQG